MRTRTWAIPVSLGVVCLVALTSCASRAGQAPHAASASAATPAAGGEAAPVSPAGPPPSARPARARACTGAQIAITLTHTGAVMGQERGYLAFTNWGSVMCKLAGWPAVDGMTQDGQTAPLARATSTMLGGRQGTSPEPAVTLAPGDSAHAVVAGTDLPVGNATGCPAAYRRLEVTIPGGTSAATVSAWLPNDDAYLPACTTIKGVPGGEVSEIVPLSILPH